jgi:structural maintenance of chromosome 4
MKKLKDESDKHRKMYDQLKRMRTDEFLEGFQKICLATSEIYQMITLGGDAALELVDSIDPFKDGVSFQ